MYMIRPGLSIALFLALRGVRKHAFSSFLAIFTIAIGSRVVFKHLENKRRNTDVHLIPLIEWL